MRIRTTRQAREIRKGIMLARDPRPITSGHLYQFPLIQRAYQRTKNRPPTGEQGNIRAPHPGWLTTKQAWQIHITPINDKIQHEEHPDCICHPQAEINNGKWIYTHHSLDGREQTEPDRKEIR